MDPERRAACPLFLLALGLVTLSACQAPPRPKAEAPELSTRQQTVWDDDVCHVRLKFVSRFRQCAWRCEDRGSSFCSSGGHNTRYCNTPDIWWDECAHDIAKNPLFPAQDCSRNGIGIQTARGVRSVSGRVPWSSTLGIIPGPHHTESAWRDPTHFDFMPQHPLFEDKVARKPAELLDITYEIVPCNAASGELKSMVRLMFEDSDADPTWNPGGLLNPNEHFHVQVNMGTWLHRCLSLNRGASSGQGTIAENQPLANALFGNEPLLCESSRNDDRPVGDCWDNGFRVKYDVECEWWIQAWGGTCGDKKCNNFETIQSCPGDCSNPPPSPVLPSGQVSKACGDGTCQPGAEDCANCPCDCRCPYGKTCFASTTVPDRGSCQPSSPQCGDGVCAPGEDCGNCYSDCRCGALETCEHNQCTPCNSSICGCGHKVGGGGAGPCGNGTCSPSNGEFCENCPADCGACPALPTAGPALVAPKLCANNLRPTFSWQPAANATHYWLFIADESEQVVASINPFEGTSYTPDFDLVAGRGYRWKVKALNTASWGVNLPWSDIAYFTPQAAACPSPTVAPTVNGPSQCAGLRPTFSWNAVPNANGYNFVLFEVVPPNDDILLKNIPVAGLSYTYSDASLPSLTDGKLYRWKVKAANSDPNALGGPYSPHAFFTARSGPCPVCGNDVTEAGEDCDATVCCTSTCRYQPAYTVCRPSAGPCDIADLCTGASGLCPVDALRVAGSFCRASTGGCDAEETCTGTTAACPADTGAVATAGTVCRPGSDLCDAPEVCNGSSDVCPPDTGAFRPSSDECRPASDLCDAPETCTGASAVCPADDGSKRPAGYVCRAATAACDAAETCSGASAACPSDGLLADGTSCNVGAGQCSSGRCAENISWTRLAGVTANGNSLSKSGPNGWDAGAVSSKVIRSGDGFVEMIARQTNTLRMFGLNRLDEGPSYGDIDFAIYPTASGTLEVYENGAHRRSVGPYSLGDRLRVEVSSGVVRYLRNGAVLHTSAVTPLYPLRADSSLYSTGAAVSDAIIFGDLAFIASYSSSYAAAWTCTASGPMGCRRDRTGYTVATYSASGPEAAVPAAALYTQGYIGSWATGGWSECDQSCGCGSTYRDVWPASWNYWGPDAERPVGQAMCNCQSCPCDCSHHQLYSSQSECDAQHTCCDGRWRDDCVGGLILCYEGCD